MVIKNANDALTLTRDVEVERRTQFSLSDSQVEALAHQALIIERHYGRRMDIEWAPDGLDGTVVHRADSSGNR